MKNEIKLWLTTYIRWFNAGLGFWSAFYLLGLILWVILGSAK